jgi:hypothetical protein
VRFGGAGACFPLLFVVRRICTTEPDFPVDENVLSFDDESAKRGGEMRFHRSLLRSASNSLTGKRRDDLFNLLLLLVLLSDMSAHLRLLAHLRSQARLRRCTRSALQLLLYRFDDRGFLKWRGLHSKSPQRKVAISLPETYAQDRDGCT